MVSMNFGRGSGSGVRSLARYVIGVPNLIKRLQAKSVLDALELEPRHVVLDFGCASGFFSVELARRSNRTFGVDANSEVIALSVPRQLNGRLSYHANGLEFFQDHSLTVDRVLLSDVLSELPDPVAALDLISQRLGPCGKIVLVQGVGRPVAERLFTGSTKFATIWQRLLRRRNVESFDDYIRFLRNSFNSPNTKLDKIQDLRNLINASSDLRVTKEVFPVSRAAGWIFEWQQLTRVILGLRPTGYHPFTLILICASIANRFDRQRWSGSALLVIGRE